MFDTIFTVAIVLFFCFFIGIAVYGYRKYKRGELDEHGQSVDHHFTDHGSDFGDSDGGFGGD